MENIKKLTILHSNDLHGDFLAERIDEDLYSALRYAANDEKTDKKMYVSAINCPKQLPYETMMDTKRRYGKLEWQCGYH